ncbi:MAG: DUF1730 domain-containing protein [Defluviitaleaceae bacterium]|nr:DUF1730 domain-containing protein [Defluviitaleaceae bacterium]
MVSEFAKQNNAIIGACHAAPLENPRLMAGSFVPFVSRDHEKRTNPARALKDVESIIVIGVPPLQKEKPLAHPPKPLSNCFLSSLGTDEDYHPRVKNLLKLLAEELKSHFGEFRYKILVDSPGLDERALAHRAGLGFFGRNGLIISREFGSRFNIGCMLTDIPLKNLRVENEENPPESECPPGCRRCLEACPGGALKHGQLEASRCVSYLTQKKELTPPESALIKTSNQLYGCDICQDVCPFNAPHEPVFVNPKDWLDKTTEDLQKEYGHTAMLWLSTELPRRNAQIHT